MSLAVGLAKREKIGSVEVGDNVLEGWEVIVESYFEEWVELVGEAEGCEVRVRKHMANGQGGVETTVSAYQKGNK